MRDHLQSPHENGRFVIVNVEQLTTLARVAWEYRERALVLGRTSVGAAALADDGTIYGGCNLQHRFRSHDVHAEVAALTAMVVAGRQRLVGILVVAEFPGLTPCGHCLDWILQMGGDDCIVGWQHSKSATLEYQLAKDMMPFHPPYGDE